MSKVSNGSRKRAAIGFTIGRDSFARISEVEGIRLSDTMRGDFREFDRKGLSAEKRRNLIAKKYGGAR